MASKYIQHQGLRETARRQTAEAVSLVAEGAQLIHALRCKANLLERDVAALRAQGRVLDDLVSAALLATSDKEAFACVWCQADVNGKLGPAQPHQPGCWWLRAWRVVGGE